MIKVLKQALAYIDNVPDDRDNVGHINRHALVIALKQAIAKLESQEPVATVTSETGNPDVMMSWWHEPALAVGTKLYTHPPQRTWERPWVSLTDEEIDLAIGFVGSLGSRQDARSIEAKLKELNA
jgi:hypothetical protein